MSVPCNGCTECCRGPDRVFVIDPEQPGIEKWSTYEKDGHTHLMQRENGDCMYLDDNGCSIQDDKPRECSAFDCREHVLNPNLRQSVAVAAIRALGRSR